MQTINCIIAIFYREYKIAFNNLYDLFSVFLFFILGIFIFIFSIGPEKELLGKISIGVLWTLLVLSTNLSIKKFYQDDFADGNIFLFYMSGLSFEMIVLIKLFSIWVFFQLPFLIIIPFACLILDIKIENIYLILIIFFLSSPILTSIASIAGSMNLLNNKNFAIGSVMIMILSIPLIIFSVNTINAPYNLIRGQISILTGIFFLFIAITPWLSAYCIKIAIRNK